MATGLPSILAISVAGWIATILTVPSKQQLIEQLRHQEDSIQTCHCVFVVNEKPQSADMKSRIREVLRQRGMEKRIGHYVFDAASPPNGPWEEEWWAKGLKERHHSAKNKSSKPTRVFAYDGQVIRTVVTGDKSVQATITTPEAASWDGSNNLTPSSLFLAYRGRKWSELIRISRNSHVNKRVVEGREVSELTFDNPIESDTITKLFAMLFDGDNRLVRRTAIGCFGGKDNSNRVLEVFHFDDYRPTVDAFGQTLWFPFKTVVWYCVGSIADGSPAVWSEVEVLVKKIDFNIDIDDAIFVPELPLGATVKDEIAGVGSIPPEDHVATWKGKPPTPAAASRWRTWYWVLLLPCSVIGIAALLCLRKRTGAAS